MSGDDDLCRETRPLAIITGASSGIGAAVARRLAARGYRGALIGRRRPLLEKLARQSFGATSCTVETLDLVRQPVGPALAAIVARHGPARVLVNSAGAGLYRMFLEHSRIEFEEIVRLNFLAAVDATRAVLPGMLARGEGTVINLASVSSKMGPWGHSSYAAAKAALVAFTQSLAAEYEGSGVHFCYVNPGIVDTEYFHRDGTHDLWPVVRRHAIPVDPVADAIVRLLDRPRLELCIPRSYRLLDWLKAASVRLTHQLVARNSRPASTPSVASVPASTTEQ
jgi:short-subunit dehydrogenase